MKFTLKVIKDKHGDLYPNDQHSYGGIDYLQRTAFEHLFIDNFVPFYQAELLSGLCQIHKWDLEITNE